MTDTATPAPLPPPLAAALLRVERAFAGATAGPGGCLACYGAEELALLGQPGVPLDEDLLRIMFHETPDHFDDHPGVLRRLLPQFLGFVARGRFQGAGYLPTGLGRGAWQDWPAEQAGAVDAFLSVWWEHTLETADPDPDVQTVFALCADMRQSVTPMLDHWARRTPGGTADRHLAAWVERWIEDLLQDDARFIASWAPDPTAEVQEWLLRHTPRLDPRIELLALPPDDRWDRYAEITADDAAATS